MMVLHPEVKHAFHIFFGLNVSVTSNGHFLEMLFGCVAETSLFWWSGCDR